MANNYLDYDGLALYDEKIKQVISGKVDKDGAKVLSTNDYTTDEKNKLAGITAGAEPNQNAFSTVSVAGTALAADTKTDTLTITAGDNVTLTPTASSDSFVIAAKDTTYPEATATKGGVLTDAQAVKLNGIATGATKNTASTTTPKMDGTAAVGTSTDYARADHVHPTDTSRASAADLSALQTTVSDKADKATTLSGYGITDAYTKEAVDDMMTDIEAAVSLIPTPDTAAPKMDGTAAAGTSTRYARADHVHPTDTSRVPVSASSSANSLTTKIENTGASTTMSLEGGTGSDDVQNLVSVKKDEIRLYASNSSNSMIRLYGNGRIYFDADSVSFDSVDSVASKTPAAGDNSTKVATTAFVTTAVANAIAGIQGISYEVVTTLPTTGKAGVIYLISNSGTAPNIYDEYIWTGTAFEKIGTTDVDLSGYQPKMDAITNTQINSLFA